jgi:hypothetical protein
VLARPDGALARRCKLHGGASTGPKTPEGRERVVAGQRARWARWREARAAQKAAEAGELAAIVQLHPAPAPAQREASGIVQLDALEREAGDDQGEPPPAAA